MIRSLFVVLALVACSKEPAPRVSVGAAAVMRHAMPELVARHQAMTGIQIDVVYGASDKLAADGKALDVLVLADPKAFESTHVADVRVIATTSLVLVGAAGAPFRFANLRDEGVIALGDPETVPAGRYAHAYLTSLGIWDAVSPRVVYAGDVAGALALAQRGTAHVAIVYASDVQNAAPLVVLDGATDGPVVKVSAAVTREGRAADAFVTFLASADARVILARNGFGEVVR